MTAEREIKMNAKPVLPEFHVLGYFFYFLEAMLVDLMKYEQNKRWWGAFMTRLKVTLAKHSPPSNNSELRGFSFSKTKAPTGVSLSCTAR